MKILIFIIAMVIGVMSFSSMLYVIEQSKGILKLDRWYFWAFLVFLVFFNFSVSLALSAIR